MDAAGVPVPVRKVMPAVGVPPLRYIGWEALPLFAVPSFVAVAALPVQEPEEPEQLPVMLALIVAGSLIVAFAVPLNDVAGPVFVPLLSET